MTRPLVNIGEIAEINPRIPQELARQMDCEVNFVPMSHLSEKGHVESNGTRRLGDVLKGYTYFQNGDVIVAKITPCMENGKAALVSGLPHPVSFGSTEFHVLRPGAKTDGRYLFYMVWNSRFRHAAEGNMTGTAGQKRVPKSFLERYQIPLPPLPEQKRIAAILDKADAIRRKRREATEALETLTVSAYIDWFGHPVSSGRAVPLGDCVTIVSGGTPSKQNPHYWNGDFPWVSPKDMKADYISDAEDHVTKLAFEETTLKKIPEASVLVVVRGMILVHTVPIALTDASVAINQDMKALLPKKGYHPEYLCWTLKAAHNYILSKVATAAHGTKRLEVEHLAAIPVPLAREERQSDFVKIAKRIREAVGRSKALESSNLFNSLVQRAFRGQL